MFVSLRKALPLLDPAVRYLSAISAEADDLEDHFGADALEWVRRRITTSRKNERTRLYRLHDELVRRRQPGVVSYRH